MEEIFVYPRLTAFTSVLLVLAALMTPTAAQETAAERAAEKKMDTEAAANSSKEPHMAAALRYLRQAEEELERANTQHGGFRQAALQDIARAEGNVVKGIQYFNTHVPDKKKK
jgi:hypothetical protein